MRLTRLRAKCEVRRTADSATTRSGGQACPEQKAWPEQGRMGWLETECPEVHDQQPRRPVLDADAGNPRRGRSQSVRSSEEASNDRGAKGHRKLVGAMTVEGHKTIQHSAPKGCSCWSCKGCRKPGCSQRGRGNASAAQAVRPGWDSQASATSGSAHFARPATGKPDARNGPVRFGGRGEVQTLVPTPIPKQSRAESAVLRQIRLVAHQNARHAGKFRKTGAMSIGKNGVTEEVGGLVE